MRYFTLTTTNPLHFSTCGQLLSRDGFLHHKRCFDQNVLILVTEGILHITAAGHPYAIGPDQYIFLKAGEEHFGHPPSSGRLSYLWVHLTADQDFLIRDFLNTPATNRFLLRTLPISIFCRRRKDLCFKAFSAAFSSAVGLLHGRNASYTGHA